MSKGGTDRGRVVGCIFVGGEVLAVLGNWGVVPWRGLDGRGLKWEIGTLRCAEKL